MEAGGRTVRVPVFVQPDSQQPCLLGMNVAPALGVSFHDAQGKALHSQMPSGPLKARVSLVQASLIPSQVGMVLEAQVGRSLPDGREVVFEPDSDGLGLGAFDSLLTVNAGRVYVPVHNVQQSSVKLETGHTLGVVELCGSLPSTDSFVNVVSPVTGDLAPSVERKEELRKVLNLPDNGLSLDERASCNKLFLMLMMFLHCSVANWAVLIL